MVAELGSMRWEREVEVRLGLPALWFGLPGLQRPAPPHRATALLRLREEQPPQMQGLGPSAPPEPLTLPGCCLSVLNRMYGTNLA